MSLSQALWRDLFMVARQHYSDLPYHNFAHAEEVLRNADIIMNRCDADGVTVDRESVQIACLFHDAGYQQEHLNEGYPSKEWLAAHIARNVLLSHHIPMPQIAKVMAIIYATDITAPARTTEEKVIKAADIANLAGSYEQFVDANARLKVEAELLGGHPISWTDWKVRTTKIVDYFYRQDLRLTRWHDDEYGRSAWHLRVVANLGRYIEDSAITD